MNEFFNTKTRRVKILEEMKLIDSIVNKKYLSKKFNVSERTIERDIKELIVKGNSIRIISGRNGGYILTFTE